MILPINHNSRGLSAHFSNTLDLGSGAIITTITDDKTREHFHIRFNNHMAIDQMIQVLYKAKAMMSSPMAGGSNESLTKGL